jgi:hypothetical protein
MSVAPRWKRRADEIAEAIGDELSINGTVSIGNDLTLSVDTITALANAITSVLNPTTIARAMWTSDIGGTHDARAVYTVDGGGYWSITAFDGVAGAAGSPAFIYHTDGTTTISARSGVEDRHEDVIFLNNLWQLPIAIVRNVSLLSTNTTPVHVQVRNIAGGFTAMASDISTSMKLTAQPVSIADTVNVKTDTGESVAISGTVNLNVGSSTVPISNPNNITVPVVNSANVTVPVNVGSATVPVRASANGTPQNSSGVNVLVSVNPTHSVTVPVSVGSATVPASVPAGLTVPASVASNLTVPVAVGGATVPAYVPNTLTVPASVPVGLTVPVAVGSNTVPVAVGSATVPVANTNSIVVAVENTNNVTIPVTASGTVLDVNITGVSSTAKNLFHEAMETALDDATGINVDVDNHPVYGGPSAADIALAINGNVFATFLALGTPSNEIILDTGVTLVQQAVYDVAKSTWINLSNYTGDLWQYAGRRIIRWGGGPTSTSWILPQTVPGSTVTGVIVDFPNYTGSTVYGGWSIRRDDGALLLNQSYKSVNPVTPRAGQDFLNHNGKAVQLVSGTDWVEIRMQ